MDTQKFNNLVLLHLGHPLNRDLCHVCAKNVAPDHMQHWLKKHNTLIPETIRKSHKLLSDSVSVAMKTKRGNPV